MYEWVDETLGHLSDSAGVTGASYKEPSSAGNRTHYIMIMKS